MSCKLFSIIAFFWISYAGADLTNLNPLVLATPTPTPSPTPIYAPTPSGSLTPTPSPKPSATPSVSAGNNQDNMGLLHFDRNVGKEADTSRMIDTQNRDYDSGNRNVVSEQKDRDQGNSRAQQMMTLLKDDEMKKAMEKATGIGNQILKDNPDLKTPSAVIAGAVGFWVGKSMKLFGVNGYGVSSQVEGKNRAGGFLMDSPLMNGKLRFSASDGVDLSMNRKISSISSQAEVKYNTKNQALSTQVRHNLMPHVDLTFGSSISPQTTQPDNRAGVEYRFSF